MVNPGCSALRANPRAECSNPFRIRPDARPVEFDATEPRPAHLIFVHNRTLQILATRLKPFLCGLGA